MGHRVRHSETSVVFSINDLVTQLSLFTKRFIPGNLMILKSQSKVVNNDSKFMI